MTIEIRRIARQLSPSLTASAAALFACGALCGWFMYLGRSPIREKYIPGTPAYWQHLLLAALAGVLFGYARWRHRRRFGPRSARLWLLAPLGTAAARRAARTMHGAQGGPSGFGRALLALPPAAVFLYVFYRCGMQVTAGLDPNGTVNAWGGPTYLGAMAFHYFDGILMLAAACWLLDLILLPDRQQDQVALLIRTAPPPQLTVPRATRSHPRRTSLGRLARPHRPRARRRR